ncbi:nuclear transport factor 2 family protein [Alteromonas sp. a30]|uniref:nuclear transport factor 2 family protein n=1 Tax=Alteromonas sp. a30 TaxID=2730917 RepID=UPI002280009E|nr:nuclear transport factor 2 family protein [Alteromonas sp. a30]MCY7295622.1 nuclear transport factor 2 family protein [Alteromonas sp. a30]
MSNAKEISLITELMNQYFDCLYEADHIGMANVFHKEARYINTVNGEYVNCSTQEYMAILEQRTPPRERGDARHDEILSIESESDNMAFVKVRLTMMGREYLDYLTLYKDDNRWQIICKVFSFKAL